MHVDRKRIASFAGALGVTAFLFLFLIFLDSIFYKPLEEPARKGSIKLSQLKDAPPQEKQDQSEEKLPEVAELKPMEPVETPMEAPPVEISMPSVPMDFTPHITGTIPLAGMPSMAAPTQKQAAPSPPKVAAQAPKAAAPSGGALTLGEVDELPRPIYAPPPPYPSSVKRRQNVTVRVRVLLGENGRVMRVTPVGVRAEHRPFLEEVRKSVMRWQFSPCKKAGKAVQCVAEQPFVFTPR